MVHLTILRDTRENKGWEFEQQNVTVEDATLATGDYTLAKFCDYDADSDTYHPFYAIERKAGQDFVSSITQGRERFQNEIKRASDWECPLLVLIEEPRTTFKRKRGFMQHRSVSPSQIFGTVDDWERYYNVDFQFVGTRERAQQRTYDTLSTRLRANLI